RATARCVGPAPGTPHGDAAPAGHARRAHRTPGLRPAPWPSQGRRPARAAPGACASRSATGLGPRRLAPDAHARVVRGQGVDILVRELLRHRVHHVLRIVVALAAAEQAQLQGEVLRVLPGEPGYRGREAGAVRPEIGRASCRERVGTAAGAGAVGYE